MGSYVSGTVKYIFADFNTRVHAGQVLAQLDPAVYQAQVIQARGNMANAQANVGNLEASIAVAQAVIQTKAQLAQAKAQVQTMSGALKQSETNLRYTMIISPINGTIVARNIDVGQSVAASLQAPVVFSIAQDLTRMQVYAKVDESDTGSIKIGTTATFQEE